MLCHCLTLYVFVHLRNTKKPLYANKNKLEPPVLLRYNAMLDIQEYREKGLDPAHAGKLATLHGVYLVLKDSFLCCHESVHLMY